MEIAAGEYGYDLDYFRRMLEAGAVDVQQADATRCGGITGFLQAAALCEAHHIDLSGHCAPALHLHAACAAPRLRHLEWFHDHVRIEHMLFDGAPVPRDGVIRPDLSRPGLGLDVQAPGRRAVSRAVKAASRDARRTATCRLGSRCSRPTARRSTGNLRLRRSARPQPLAGPAHSTAPATVQAARRLNRAAGMLALSVLLDSAVEHYRGSFQNQAMYTPLVVVGADTGGQPARHRRTSAPGAHRLRDAIYALAAATGLVGTGFHIYNVAQAAGGFSWQNLFYGAPLGAPMAILLSGLLGFCCGARARHRAGTTPRVLRPAGRARAGGADRRRPARHAGEAGLLHFRGAFHNPFMLLPVTVPPVARRAAGARRRWAAARPRSLVHALVAAADRAAGLRRRRLPRLRRVAATWAAGATGARTC